MAVNQLKKTQQSKAARERARKPRANHEPRPIATRSNEPEITSLIEVLRGRFPTDTVEGSLAGLPKISDRIDELIHVMYPDERPWRTLREFEFLLEIIANGWNLSLHAPAEFAKRLRSFPVDMRSAVGAVAIAKRVSFPDDPRTIVDFEVSGTANEPHFAITSTFDRADERDFANERGWGHT